MSGKTNYGFGSEADGNTMPVPTVDYLPRRPQSFTPRIGLIGCGGITQQHCTAYRKAGFEVVAMADLDRNRAEARRDEFFPEARICATAEEVCALDEVNVIDAATHPDDRVVVITQALEAGKHVLSQKPFVLDLDIGEKLVALAAEKALRLAVNHNGRWAPHWSWMRGALENDLLGTLDAIHCQCDWDHNWIVGSPFDRIRHILLYDYAIHWFDICTVFYGFARADTVFAETVRAPTQRARHPLVGNAVIRWGQASAALSFNGNTLHGGCDRTALIGSKGTLRADGPNLNEHQLTLATEEGTCTFTPEGQWIPDGFAGSMGELLCAIEEEREPLNSARTNLRSLELAFAAIRSAETGQPVAPGTVRSAGDGCKPVD